jgi:hypothetical protein
MKRVIAATLVLSVLGSLFAVAPALGATYTASGSCSWVDPVWGLGMVKGYPEMTFASRDEAKGYVTEMKADCGALGGKLSSTITQA